jgi:hypothetical protein
MVVDKIVGGHITLVPCGLNEKGEVKELDVVVGDELFHATDQISSLDLVNWMHERLYKKKPRMGTMV